VVITLLLNHRPLKSLMKKKLKEEFSMDPRQERVPSCGRTREREGSISLFGRQKEGTSVLGEGVAKEEAGNGGKHR